MSERMHQIIRVIEDLEQQLCPIIIKNSRN